MTVKLDLAFYCPFVLQTTSQYVTQLNTSAGSLSHASQAFSLACNIAPAIVAGFYLHGCMPDLASAVA